MLPKSHRLPAFIFDRVLGSDKRIISDKLRIFIRANSLPVSRFGIVVSSKAVPRAHSRNRCKRLVRETIRLNLAKIRSGLDVVILINSDISAMSQREVAELLLEIWHKNGIINDT
ncbi:ribonuclease P protein component [Candidatus Gottesmanbacteria bacterium RBG_16_43_7]|uniref:Ribonuclease P protein component n=1 Tax=Candidatus Gottesmanbacteria bacterium RBG_16_43_7 TaxID=1798373 RepID=A0A1F5Z8A2_9BACT|nr:MAG: ribonuclease P protein component [Candidatus Gottesmanbacteria bacterium RBG_16_43_7]